MAGNNLKYFYRQLNLALSEKPKILEEYLNTSVEPVGKDYRLNPCPYCGHLDCATLTPGVEVINCFSPACKAYPITQVLIDRSDRPKRELLAELAQRLNVPLPANKVADDPRQKLLAAAVEFYHRQLLNNPEAYSYLVNTRKRKPETIERMKVGLGGNEGKLITHLRERGFEAALINENRDIRVSCDVLIYPYYDPDTGEILRLNTKAQKPLGPKTEGGAKPEAPLPPGYSVGKRALYLSPDYTTGSAIVVEGENDLMALMEQGAWSVVATGGSLTGDIIDQLSGFSKLYLMLDNDAAGESMTEKLNESLPHIPVYRIDYSHAHGDPDEYYRTCPEPISLDELIKEAKLMETKASKVVRQGGEWVLLARRLRLVLENATRRNGEFAGTLKLYRNGELADSDYGKKLTKYTGAEHYTVDFQAKLEEIHDTGIEGKDASELMDIYPLTLKKKEVIQALARAFDGSDDKDGLLVKIAKALGQDTVDEILREVNAIQSQEAVDITEVRQMKIAQFFSASNNDAYFYFTYVRKDGEVQKKLPYLLSNRKSLIRLDLFRRKEENSMLLLEGKYELPIEVTQAVGEMEETSLGQAWVESFIAGEIPAEELSVSTLVARIESLVRRFYHHRDERLYKVIALWIYGTYYYELFKVYPYLYLNGKKGSGKSRLSQVLRLFCFNPKYGVNLTGPALFRLISIVGGTIIIDEVESLTDRRSSQESDLSQVFKAGYEEGPGAYRCEGDTEKGYIPKRYTFYGPKVVSNIFGIDDVISDRCVPVHSFEAPAEITLLDPKIYLDEHRQEIKDLTSKCCLSALMHFQTVYTQFREERFTGASKRLSQILMPLFTLANLAGPEYRAALDGYYRSVIVDTKKETDNDTPEGLILTIVKQVARELTGRSERDLTNLKNARFDGEIVREEGAFQVADLHLKVWMEEEKPGEKYSLKTIGQWLRRAFQVEMTKRTRVDITDPSLCDEFNGRRPNIAYYRFHYKDLIADYAAGEEIEVAAVMEAAKTERIEKLLDEL